MPATIPDINSAAESLGQWPFKYLWNTLRGESIVADDEVILEELRNSYPQLVKGLMMYITSCSSASTTAVSSPVQSVATSAATTVAVSSTGAGDSIKTVSTSADYSAFLKRVSTHLELDENIASKVFTSYIMFEYRGAQFKLSKILESRPIQTEFLDRLKTFYLQERMSILLCIQALFDGMGDVEHKYKRIFDAFDEFLVQNGVDEMVKNLIESLNHCIDFEEELNVLYALTVLLSSSPNLAIEPFVKHFKGFTEKELTDPRIEIAEAGLMFCFYIIPIWPNRDFPSNIKEALKKMFEEYHEAMDEKSPFIFPAACAFKIFSDGQSPSEEQFITIISSLTYYSHLMTNFYLTNSSCKRHGICGRIQRSVYLALVAVRECYTNEFPDDMVFRVSSLLNKVLYKCIPNITNFMQERPEIVNIYAEATYKFPTQLQPLLEIWSSMLSAFSDPLSQIQMLNELGSTLKVVSEISSEPIVFGRTDSDVIGYTHPTDRIVSTVLVPTGCPVTYFQELDHNLYLTSWDMGNGLPDSPWKIIFQYNIKPIMDRVNDGLPTPDGLWNEMEGNNLIAICKFLIEFATNATCCDKELFNLYPTCAIIMTRAMDLTRSQMLQAEYGVYVIRLTDAAVKMGNANWGHEYLKSIFPSSPEHQNLVSTLIMGYESLGNDECNVTQAFLDTTLRLLSDDYMALTLENQELNSVGYYAVMFINDNVFHSYTRWRRMRKEIKNRLLLTCLKIYNQVYNAEGFEWLLVKSESSRALLSASSSLISILSIDDKILDESVLNPTETTILIPEIMYQSLSLLLKLFHYQKQSISLVDESLGMTLVKKLGRFAKHRLDYRIPTLAMAVLKKIAEELLNMSLLSCFGNEDSAFRDLILQRLEFKSEDINLKVAILEFLAVAAHTQPGLIQFIFMDEVLAQKIVDLPTDKDENLSLSVLVFLRAMFCKGATVMKQCKNLWENMFLPIKTSKLSNFKIVTCALNISTIELYYNGIREKSFETELKAFLAPSFFKTIIRTGLLKQGQEVEKFLQALRHLNIVLMYKFDKNGEGDEIMPVETKKMIIESASDAFWSPKEAGYSFEDSGQTQIEQACLAQIMCQFSRYMADDPEYIVRLGNNLTKYFTNDVVGIQIPLLCLTLGCLKNAKTVIQPQTLENIIRTVVRILDNCQKIFEHGEFNYMDVVLSRAVNILVMIIQQSDICPQWDKLFKYHLVPNLIIRMVRCGIQSNKGYHIVLEALYLLVKLSDPKYGCNLLLNSEIADNIWHPMIRFAAPDIVDKDWEKVYLVALDLTTKMLLSQKHYFVEEILNFWGIHGIFISHKLWSLSEMTKHCVINDPEQNFTMMKNLLSFNIFVLNTVTAMLPHHEEWKRLQQNEFERILQGVYAALNTAVNLLNQPGYLHVVITLGKNQNPNVPHAQAEPQISPQLIELQSQLWDVISLGSNILYQVRKYANEIFKSDLVLGTANQIAQSCIKGLTKTQQPSVGVGHQFPVSARTVPTLEKTLTLYLYHATKTLDNPALTGRSKITATREIASDVATLVDGAKRVTGKTLFMVSICLSLEKEFCNLPVSRISHLED